MSDNQTGQQRVVAGGSSKQASPGFSPKAALQDLKKGAAAMSTITLGPSATAAAPPPSLCVSNEAELLANISIPNVVGATPDVSPMLQPAMSATASASSGPQPSLHFQLANDKKTTVTVKDVSNLALWGINPKPHSTAAAAAGAGEPDNGGMLVESPRWALLKARYCVKHVTVLYLNGITYEQILSNTQLAQLLLKPLRKAEFLPKAQNSASGNSLMATAYGGGGGGSGATAGGGGSADSEVQMAPIWVNSTKNNLEHDFFFRYERRFNNSQQQPGGGAGGGGERPANGGVGRSGGDSGPTRNYNNRTGGDYRRSEIPSSTVAAAGGADSPGGSPQMPPKKANDTIGASGGTVGLKHFMAALRKADEAGGPAPKSESFFHKDDFKPTVVASSTNQHVKAQQKQQYVPKWTTLEDAAKPRLSWTEVPPTYEDGSAMTSQSHPSVPEGGFPRGVEGVDMAWKWKVALDASLVPASPSLGPGGAMANPDPTKHSGNVKGHSNAMKAVGKPASAGVHLEDLVMPREDQVEHGFIFEYPLRLPGSTATIQNELLPFPEARLVDPIIGPAVAPPSLDEGGGGNTGSGQQIHDTQQFAVALDCEMVMTDDGSSLARLTVISVPSGACLIDMLVKPSMPVNDYVTRYSGITEEMLADCPFTLQDAQRRLQKLIAKKYTYVIGHGLENDFLACRMDPTGLKVIDTTFLFPHVSGLPLKNALKFLMNRYFRRSDFQQGEHDSAEDAAACIELVGLKLRRGVEYGRPRRNNVFGTPNLTKESGVQVCLVDRSSNCARLIPHKASHCTPIPCISDDDVAKKVVKHFWKVRTAEQNAVDELAAATKKGELADYKPDILPATFTWMQLRDCYFPEVDPFVLQKLRKMKAGSTVAVDGWQPPKTTAGLLAEAEADATPGAPTAAEAPRMTTEWLERIVEGNDPQEQKDTQRILRVKANNEKERRDSRQSKRAKRDRDDAEAAAAAAQGAAPVEGDDVPGAVTELEAEIKEAKTTVTMEIHKLNMRLGAILNAVPEKSLVLVVAANCREGSLNQLSAAHGALFGFVKDEANRGYSLLPQDMIEVQQHLQEQEAQAKSCAPQ